jgi:hypothetical protein
MSNIEEKGKASFRHLQCEEDKEPSALGTNAKTACGGSDVRCSYSSMLVTA